MVQYNTKDWVTFIFKFHKSDTFRQLMPLMIVISIYTGVICYLEIHFFKLSENSHVKNITLMHSTLGVIISLLMAYRTNTAYERWWEGRKLWGSLVNNSRNLAVKLSIILTEENDTYFFKRVIPGYAAILAKHLGNDKISEELFENINQEILPEKHKPNQVAKMLFHKINDLYKEGKITGNQLIIINNEISAFTDVCGACERIKNTPIPYSYNVFIKKFIFFFVMTLPFSFAFSLGFYSIPVVVFIFYVLASLELIAEEIEDPFGGDDNDLPTARIATNIKKHVEEIFN